jgi:predicted DNA-binding transcriptional regulator AlpA
MSEQSDTVVAWCTRRQISRSMFYKLQREGKAPRTYRIGARQYISSEADREWRQQREAEAAAR